MICYCPHCQAEVPCTAEDRTRVCDQCQQSFAVAVRTLSPQESARLRHGSDGWMRSLLTLAGILLAVWIAALVFVPGGDRSQQRVRRGDESRTAVSNYLMATLEHPDFIEQTWHIGEMDNWAFQSLEPSGSILTNPCAEVRTGDPYVVVRLSFQARDKNGFSFKNRAMTFLVNSRTNKVFAAGEQPPAELFDLLLRRS